MSVLELMKTRRTFRRFAQRPIPEEALSDILEAARFASSAANLQPLKYLIIESPDRVSAVFEHTRWAGYLPPEQGFPPEDQRPVLFAVVLIDTDISQNAYADTDAGLAISNMTLAAWEHGIGSCIIGSFDREWIASFFDLPHHLKAHSLVAFGYPLHTSVCEDLSDSVRYYLDSDGNYHVPKRRTEDVVHRL